MVVGGSFVGGPLVGRRAVAGVARLHAGGVALRLGGLTLWHQQLGLALHGGAARRCLAFPGYAAGRTRYALLTYRDGGSLDCSVRHW